MILDAVDPALAAAEAALRTDFRSDTVTHPTPEMRAAMAAAPVGDDVFGEDPTINDLEAVSARLFEKEAALFVSSGTQGNLLGLMTLSRPGEEAIVEASTHMANYEVGGAARLAGVTLRTVDGSRGQIPPEGLADLVRPDNVHYARTTLLCVENTHNGAGGTVTTLEQMDALSSVARRLGLKLYVDGARIFNAAVALKVPVAALARHADALSFCLSKGLGAPAGSVLVGSRALVDEARRFRKMLGGGMRQAGVLAAAGLVALESGVERLSDDHRRVRLLAEGLVRIPGIDLDLSTVESNIVRFDVSGLGHTTATFTAALAEVGVKVTGGAGRSGARMVTHRHIDDAAVDEALERIRTLRPAGTAGNGRAVYG